MTTYDEMFSSDGRLTDGPCLESLIVSTPSSDTDLASLHPTPVHIFRLWQIFVDRINPLTKILHAPTVQQKVLEASADLDNVSTSTEALMFSIYYFAATALLPGESEKMFGQEQMELRMRYKRGVHQALVNAKFLKSSDIVTLQAFVLYLVSQRCTIEKLRLKEACSQHQFSTWIHGPYTPLPVSPSE